MDLLQKIITEFSKLDYVDAICLSGSRTGVVFDEKSDFDIYIYSSRTVEVEFRKNLAKKYAAQSEIANDFFGEGDEWLLANGVEFDFMYRETKWLDEEITRVLDKHQVGVGYSTCFLYNIKTSKILFDRNGEFALALNRLEQPYPQELTEAIIAKNYPLLKSKLCASFYDQTKKAIERKDFVSVNHRTSAFIASYFDVLFALNKTLHPGEKKLIKFAKELCKILPKDFENDVANVTNSTPEKRLFAMDKLIYELTPLIS